MGNQVLTALLASSGAAPTFQLQFKSRVAFPLPPGTTSRMPSLTPEQEADLKEAFELFDTDDSNSIDCKELKVAMKALGFDPTDQEVTDIVQSLDTDGNMELDFNEFKQVMSGRMQDKDKKQDMVKAFGLLDKDAKGVIEFKDLRRMANEIGEAMSDEELLEMIRTADKNQDQKITQVDFVEYSQYHLSLSNIHSTKAISPKSCFDLGSVVVLIIVDHTLPT